MNILLGITIGLIIYYEIINPYLKKHDVFKNNETYR